MAVGSQECKATLMTTQLDGNFLEDKKTSLLLNDWPSFCGWHALSSSTEFWIWAEVPEAGKHLWSHPKLCFLWLSFCEWFWMQNLFHFTRMKNMICNLFVRHRLKLNRNSSGHIRACRVGVIENITHYCICLYESTMYTLKNGKATFAGFSTLVEFPPPVFQYNSTAMHWPMQGECKRQMWTRALQGGSSLNPQTRTDQMQNVK